VAAPIIAMNHESVTQLFAASCPWLALVWCLQRIATRWRLPLYGWALLTLTGAIAAVVLLVPIQGLVIARWVAGLNANFSIPFTGMLGVAVCERAFARRIFSVHAWMTGWTFGAIAGVALYPLALGLGSVDPYEWGWRFSPLFIAMGALTAWLIWKRNRCGFLLLLAVVAFQLRLLESTNYWDYLVDPIYWLVSLVVLIRRGVSVRARLRPQPGSL
jgi:MFS family permease